MTVLHPVVLLLQRRLDLPQLEHTGHNPTKQSIPGPSTHQEPNNPATVTLPDRGLATLCPGPQPAPWCRPIQHLVYHAAGILLIWHGIVLTMHHATIVFRLNRHIQRVGLQCALRTSNTRLHTTGNDGDHLDTVQVSVYTHSKKKGPECLWVLKNIHTRMELTRRGEYH